MSRSGSVSGPSRDWATSPSTLEHGVYEPRSLQTTEDGIRFTLRNPPLRMGAFESIRVALDGIWADPARAWVHPGGTLAPIPFHQIDRARPVTLPIGARTQFLVQGLDASPRRARVRMELKSVAIPPLVWFEFADELRPEPPGA